jgi:hypothetical protein
MSDHTNVQKFVAALVGPFQDIENMFHQLVAMRDVNTSIGVHLTTLGNIVGRGRNGVSDDEIHRRYVRAQILTNKSDGVIDDLIRIAELVVFDDNAEYVVDNQGAAALVLRVEDIALTPAVVKVLITMLRKAVKGGVRIILEYWPSTATRFRFAPFGGGASSGAGWGFTQDAGVGGHLAGARE